MDPLFANTNTKHSIKYTSQSLAHAHSALPRPPKLPARAELPWSHQVLWQATPTPMLVPSLSPPLPGEPHGLQGLALLGKDLGVMLRRSAAIWTVPGSACCGASVRCPRRHCPTWGWLPGSPTALRNQPQAREVGAKRAAPPHTHTSPAPGPSKQEVPKPHRHLSLHPGLWQQGEPHSARAACPCAFLDVGPQPCGPIYC